MNRMGCNQSWSQTWWHQMNGRQRNCLFATHKQGRVVNTVIDTIGQIRQLKLKRPVCERTRGSSSGLPDHVWFGSCGATSAQQAYDLSAVHAPFCCSHGGSQAVGCLLSVSFSGWYFAHDIGHLCRTCSRWIVCFRTCVQTFDWSSCPKASCCPVTFSICLRFQHLIPQWSISLLSKVVVITGKYFSVVHMNGPLYFRPIEASVCDSDNLSKNYLPGNCKSDPCSLFFVHKTK